MAKGDPTSGRVLLQVCIECGNEYFYDDQEPPSDLTCDKCGNGVFRSFHSDTRENEAAEDFRETTERDTGMEDGAGEVTRGDLHDLETL